MTNDRPPKVSIVVPVFNGARHLRECLDSLLAQTWKDKEIIVMDDASSDATAAIAAEFGDAIVYHRQGENRGQFANVEDGLHIARGEYIAVYHADDVYDTEIVQTAVSFLDRHADVGLVFCLDRFIDDAGRNYGQLQLPRELQRRLVLSHVEVVNALLEFKNVFMPTPGAMARATLYRQVGGFDRSHGSAADLDMWLRLARLAHVGIIERHLFSYRHSVTSVGQSYQKLRLESENFFCLMDRHLADVPATISPAARRAFAAHRAVDGLRVAVNAYILGDLRRARAAHAGTTLGALLSSDRIRRPRHLILWVLVAILARMPRSAAAASALHHRYYGRLPWWNAST